MPAGDTPLRHTSRSADPADIGPLENGCVGVVEKPFTAESLKATLPLIS